jgi:hypothetical protein
MATGTIVVLVIVLVLIASAALAGFLLLRRRALRRRFGAEYDQLAGKIGARRARAELIERERRVAQLDIRPLSHERRAGYGREWLSLQERFVDDPAQSAEAAAALISAVAADRGYRVDDEERLLGDLSVHHADRLDGYRRAREITRQSVTAGTEELRQALLSYRVLFRDLIAPEPRAGQPSGAAEPAAPDHKTPAAANTPAAERATAADSDTAEPGTTADGDAAQGGTAANADDAQRQTAAMGDSAERRPAAEGDETDGETGADGDASWADSGRDRVPAPAARKE